MTVSLIPSKIRDSSPQWFLSPPIVSRNIAIFNVSTESGVSIIGVELTSGKKLWERPLSQYPPCYWSLAEGSRNKGLYFGGWQTIRAIEGD